MDNQDITNNTSKIGLQFLDDHLLNGSFYAIRLLSVLS